MRKILLASLLSAITIAPLGFLATSCNNHTALGRTFNDSFRFPVLIGPLRIHYAVSLTQQQVSNATDAIVAHWTAFIINFGQPSGNVDRDVYVYDLAFLNAPYLGQQKGWVDIDHNFRINVVIGDCDTVPDMTHQLVHSYYFPYEIYHQFPNVIYWLSVELVQDDVVLQLKYSRHCALH